MENGKKEDVRSWCHDWPPGFARSTQEARLTGTVYFGDKKREWELPALIRSLRPGSVIEVVETFLLASQKGRADVRRRSLEVTVEAIQAKGAIIRELATGHDSRSQLPRMMIRAVELIGRSGRGKRSAVNGAKSQGRPRKFTREQKAAARQIWFSREHNTADQAVAAMQSLGINAKRTHCYNTFGPRSPQVGERD